MKETIDLGKRMKEAVDYDLNRAYKARERFREMNNEIGIHLWNIVIAEMKKE